MATVLREAVSRADYTRRIRALTRDLDGVSADTLRAVLALVDELRRTVIADLALVPQDDGGWPAYRLRALLDNLNAVTADTTRRLDAALRAGTTKAFQQGAALQPAALGLDLGPANTDQLVIAQSLQADLVAKVTDEFRVKAAREVQLVTAGFKSPHEATQAIGELLWTQPARRTRQMGPIASQAERVVRTEVMSVFNLADQAQDEQLTVAVPGLRKWWDSASDGRTRPDHAAAESRYQPGGSTGPIPLDEDFRVGGERAAGPHDPRLSAAQRVNCRCIRAMWSAEWAR